MERGLPTNKAAARAPLLIPGFSYIESAQTFPGRRVTKFVANGIWPIESAGREVLCPPIACRKSPRAECRALCLLKLIIYGQRSFFAPSGESLGLGCRSSGK